MKMENFYHGSICASVEYVGLYFNIFGLYLVSIFIKNGLYFGLYRDQNQIETKLFNTAFYIFVRKKNNCQNQTDWSETEPFCLSVVQLYSINIFG